MAITDPEQRDPPSQWPPFAPARRTWPARPAFLEHWNSPRAGNNPQPSHDAALELDCLRGEVPPDLLQAAEVRARNLNIGADRVLIQWGAIDEDAYLQRLAAHLDIATETFERIDRADSPLLDRHMPCAAKSGLIPLWLNGQLIWTLAPRQFTSRRLCEFVDRFPSLRARTRMTTASSLQQFLTLQGGDALADAAANGLMRSHPAMSAGLSARTGAPWWQRLQRGAAVAALLALPPMLMPAWCGNIMALWFLAFVALRLTACFWPLRTPPRPSRLPDAQLPVYTVVAALYREARSVASLLRGIEALDYPREKLDVILVIEPNDLQTRAAIARLRPPPHVRVLTAPPVAPRTKPKALNCALTFARGSFITVLDAEDRPDPGQLRAALDAFRIHDPSIACVQASLCIDNLTHSWLSRTFAAEYAGQFDAFLPGMSALGLPLPLGGTSNHFRTAILREVGGWDPYNVTEDADLGFRLARFGYRSVSFASTTFEEAPISFGNWLYQRSRWMKGWVQTWHVHMRRPVRLWRDLGPGGFLTLNLIVGGNVLTALAHPVLLYTLLTPMLDRVVPVPASIMPDSPAPLHVAAISAGYLSSIVVGLLGLRRRGQLRHGWVLALTPLYWLCLSAAAWRAVAKFVWCPFQWEKTQHGVAERQSAEAVTQAGSQRSSEPDATDSASGRWRLRPAIVSD